MKKTIVLLFAGALLAVSLDACERIATDEPNRTTAPKFYCTVDFDLGNGTIVAQQRVPAGGTLIVPPVPVREGYAFVDWTVDLARENPWHFDTDTVACSMILYAKWEENR